MRLLIAGGGWAGLAAAVMATQQGHAVTLIEASPHWGGRARSFRHAHAPVRDNGQHILVGAYRHTLSLMQTVGVPLSQALLACPLDLRLPDGRGLAIPTWASQWPAPLDLLTGIASARGWQLRDKLSLLRLAVQWRRTGYRVEIDHPVARWREALTDTVYREWLEPLCLSALNTPADSASAAVLLQVLHDALLGDALPPYRPSTLLLPRVPLDDLLPGPATRWLMAQGAQLHTHTRLRHIRPTGDGHWHIQADTRASLPDRFDRVILACTERSIQRLWPEPSAPWQTLTHWPIATTYLQTAPTARWPGAQALCALDSGPQAGPAQFAFDRSRLGGPPGEWALVSSACTLPRAELEAAALSQAVEQLGLSLQQVESVHTVLEKQATFACTPGLQRPPMRMAPGLWRAGDQVDGPYPATLEGAVRSGQAAALAASSA